MCGFRLPRGIRSSRRTGRVPTTSQHGDLWSYELIREASWGCYQRDPDCRGLLDGVSFSSIRFLFKGALELQFTRSLGERGWAEAASKQEGAALLSG